MTNATKEKLKVWAENNNWSSYHPSDTERFWDFVITAYDNKDNGISEDEFYGFLSSYSTDEDILTSYYIKYEDGIELLRCYNKE